MIATSDSLFEIRPLVVRTMQEVRSKKVPFSEERRVYLGVERSLGSVMCSCTLELSSSALRSRHGKLNSETQQLDNVMMAIVQQMAPICGRGEHLRL